jgi:type I restriction enzyme M protein
MQPLQRSYSITEESIENMLQKGALNTLYDEAKVLEYEEQGTTILAKDKKKYDEYLKTKPLYDSILEKLNSSISEKKWMSPKYFTLILEAVLGNLKVDKKLFDKIMDGLSVMDKNAEIQRDKKGDIIYDKETKDTEIVKFGEDIEDYMAREVLPHIPDAQWFFEENLSAKKTVIKTGAEIPFTRYFYKYQQPTPSKELADKFIELEKSVSSRIASLFGGE